MQCTQHVHVTTTVTGTQDFFKDRGLIERLFLASNLNNCIPELSVPLMVFAGV